MSTCVAGAVAEANQQQDGNERVRGVVKPCPVQLVLTIQRIREWPKNDEGTSANAKQGGTISTYKLERVGTRKALTEGFMLEAAGPSTKTAGTDQRIPAGTYGIIDNPGTKGPYRFVQTSKSLATATFGERFEVNIHVGNFPTELEGCFCPGQSWSDNEGAFPSVSTSRPQVKELETHIEGEGTTEVVKTYDGRDEHSRKYFTNVTVIVREIAT
ncbi:DUF5675 family protein [Chondromyces crocatus]|uniref:DUF5675 domain-containing protein n=1 Tax=Chondromyces crocatus TaxID=52 RepID=A0A0K1EF83_CHOCO|nr:DUF5675 family protein [Chondromyces crocatus]AKT39526.1 uncharacterized protein CMC5_036730 [Chondromyces crocatus]